MKKIIAIGIIGMFLLTSFSVFSVAEEKNSSDQITMDYAFETPVIADVDIDSSIYDKITIEGAPCSGNPGEPSLPSRGAYILLPQGKKVSEIIVTPGEMVCLGSDYFVEPVGESVPLSEIDSAPLPVPDEKIYSSDEPFPGRFFTKVGTYNCKGYEILVLRLHPVQYIPMSGELFYYSDLSVSVETVEDGDVSSLFRGLKKDEQEIMTKVENPTMVSSYDLNTQQQTIPGQSTPPAYDLLIITSEALKDGFEPLKQAHEEDGLSTLIYTVEDIYNGYYPGVDNAEKIRNFIKFAYNTFGIEYVLLGGDDDIVPARRLWVQAWPGSDYTTHMPSDLYYGCLDDGAWNKPEIPYPSDKDLSINDSGIWGYCSGNMTGPVVDYANYIMGDSSMRCDFTGGETSSLKLRFSEPIDLSEKKWVNFQINTSRSDLDLDMHVKLKDRKGFSTDYMIGTFFWSNDDSEDGWVTINYEINQIPFNPPFFNYKKVKEIDFEFDSNATVNDFIRLDGLYFSVRVDECWGEPGEDDLYAEVYFGRACVDNSSEVENFVNKTISYMNTDIEDEYLKKVLLAGEKLDIMTWGGDALDELIGICLEHGYNTQGFPEDKFNFDKLYDYWPDNYWPKSEIISRINQGVHIINHIGHGNNYHVMKLDEPVYMRNGKISGECHDVVEKFTNDKYFFVYSHACDSGAFDNNYNGKSLPYDCIAEYLTVKTEHGAFAGILNARYGWHTSGITDGPSQRFMREFWDAVFSEGLSVFSKANQDSKEDNIYRISDSCMRWCYYGLNLFGDPAVDFPYHFQNNQPNKPDTPSGPTSGQPRVEYYYTTCTTDPDGHPVQYGWDWDDIYPIEWTDFYPSGTPVTVSHSWIIGGPREIRVKARDVFGAESDWSDPLPVTMPVNQPSSQQSTPASTTSSSPSN